MNVTAVWHRIFHVTSGVFFLTLIHVHCARADVAPFVDLRGAHHPLYGPVLGPYVGRNAPLIVFFSIVILAVGARLALIGIRRALRRKGRLEAEKKGLGGRLVSELVFVAIVGFIAALIAPNFGNFRFNRKTREVRSNLGAIRSTQVAYVAEWNFYVGNQPPTPIANRAGKKWWDYWDSDTRFSILGFAPEGGVFCSYSLEGTDHPTLAKGFTARAECDLDGDGSVSVFTVTNASSEIMRSGGMF
jgi:type II secretory pathway pseudopilin PulG